MYHWPCMKEEIVHFVKIYLMSQMNKTSNQKQGVLMQPLRIQPRPWHIVSMDLTTSLPKSQQYDAILVMVEKFTKFAHIVPTMGTATMLKTAKLFLNPW